VGGGDGGPSPCPTGIPLPRGARVAWDRQSTALPLTASRQGYRLRRHWPLTPPAFARASHLKIGLRSAYATAPSTTLRAVPLPRFAVEDPGRGTDNAGVLPCVAGEGDQTKSGGGGGITR